MADTNNWDIKQLVKQLVSAKGIDELLAYKVLLDAYTVGYEAGKKHKKT